LQDKNEDEEEVRQTRQRQPHGHAGRQTGRQIEREESTERLTNGKREREADRWKLSQRQGRKESDGV